MIGMVYLLAVFWFAYCVVGYVIACLSLFVIDVNRPPFSESPLWEHLGDLTVAEVLWTLGRALPLAVTWPAIAYRWMKDR